MTKSTARNITLYPWYRAAQGLLFWQAIWFLYFQSELSAADAVLLYVVFDLSATLLEVPLGIVSDKIGRRITLTASCAFGALGAGLIAFGTGFEIYAAANLCLGAWAALASGADSALLYESLEAEGRTDEVETHEMRGWQAHFTALAISAVAGGAMAYLARDLPYIAVTLALAVGVAITLQFKEPVARTAGGAGAIGLGTSLRESLSKPVLLWLFVFGLLMYGFNHVLFVFGQPFIEAALGQIGAAGGAPVVSGAVTSIMMLASLLVSLFAPGLRRRFGLRVMLLFAVVFQIVLIGVAAIASSVLAIGLLVLRMVPNAMFTPFLLARIQPELGNESRATFLSIQSLCGRLVFALSLYLASFASSQTGAMDAGEVARVMGGFTLAGIVAVVLLWIWSSRVPLNDTPAPKMG